ncbi:MAG: hypothetical protein PWP03_694 [Candidatus Woesearchaeota archaeon]|nr:hypothetical protein [Candidatus Woesearchaeota archaeon]
MYAFEPAQPILKNLRQNIKRNHLKSIVVMPYGLSSNSAEFEFLYFEGFEGSSRIND